MTKTYHLSNDFGVSKQRIKSVYYYGDLHYEYPKTGELLKRRTQRYTLEEIEELFGFLTTSHDECIMENPDDYTPLQIYAAEQKTKSADRAYKLLARIKLEDAAVPAEAGKPLIDIL